MEIIIKLDDAGQLSVSGITNNEIFMLGVMAKAVHVIESYFVDLKKGEQSRIIQPTLSLVKDS